MASTDFLRLLRHPLKFRLYLLGSIPSAFFSGVRIEEADETHCVVRIPYKWFSKNPFRSTYFACLSMAAEMSTGILAMAHIYKRQPPVSMLVTGLEARFIKKATGVTRFQCTDGLSIKTTIDKAVAGGDGQTIKVRSIGTDSTGEEIAEFFITWSFKVKSPKEKDSKENNSHAEKSTI